MPNAENTTEDPAERGILSDPDGRLYRLTSLMSPNVNRADLTYEFLGITAAWRWTRERMEAAHKAGQVIQKKPGAVPVLKRYLDQPGPGMLALRVPTDQAEGTCRVDDRPFDFRIEGREILLRCQEDPSRGWQTWNILDEGSEPEALRRPGSTLLRLLPKTE